ncbi:nuclear transport factor 2 family protein [Gimibacter soli]|uniref:Nuclear transport factor 2 family protein n=1 Tax=Gimibacter soli TaxID=3024400 RepID=A0AAE9XMF5_9PROT|nr:nuclear transport factor 2 family protein [Gimibacter soli]WCL52916.1 nuclear transport factor 2 family protein [Gimibacter soli]
MTLDLPKPVSAYFEADRSNKSKVGECFTEHATVIDERMTYTGRQAIQDWKDASDGKYSYTVDPFDIGEDGDRVVVTAHLVGNFPGSPVDLRYAFTLEKDKISSLEIRP